MVNKTSRSEPTLNQLSRRGFAALFLAGAANTLILKSPDKALAEVRTYTDSGVDSSGNASTISFTDSLGRAVMIPTKVNAVTPLGIQAQTLVEILCGDSLVSLALNMNADSDDYKVAGLEDMLNLPRTNITSSTTVLDDLSTINEAALFGSSDVITDLPDSVANVEAAASAVLPDVILDVGFVREGISENLDRLQSITGIPCVFLDIAFGKLPQAFRMLGNLVSSSDTTRAESLATYVESVQAMTTFSVDATSGKSARRVLYAPRENGLVLNSGASVQLDAISHIGAVPYTSAYDYSNKTIQIESVSTNAVDLVVFDDAQCFSSLLSASGEAYDVWRASSAVTDGVIALSPALMHSWFGSPIFVQSIGLLWLSQVVWPEYCIRDLVEEARNFYSLFYNMEKHDSDWNRLLGFNATSKDTPESTEDS